MHFFRYARGSRAAAHQRYDCDRNVWSVQRWAAQAREHARNVSACLGKWPYPIARTDHCRFARVVRSERQVQVAAEELEQRLEVGRTACDVLRRIERVLDAETLRGLGP